MSNKIEVTMEHFAETSANARFHRTGEFSGVLDGVIISVKQDELPVVEDGAQELAADEAAQEAAPDDATAESAQSSEEPQG